MKPFILSVALLAFWFGNAPAAGQDTGLVAVSARLQRELVHSPKAGTLANIRFSPRGKYLIAHDIATGTVVLWEVGNGQRRVTIPTGSSYRFLLSPDWNTLFVPRLEGKGQVDGENGRKKNYDLEGEVEAWDVAAGRIRKTLQARGSPRYLAHGIVAGRQALRHV